MLSHGRIAEVYARIAEQVAAPRQARARRRLRHRRRVARVRGARRQRDRHRHRRRHAGGRAPQAVPARRQRSSCSSSARPKSQDRFAPESLDAVVSCLAMSELSRRRAGLPLRVAYARLVPGGAIVIADETLPGRPAVCAWRYRLRRLPLVAATYLLTQTTTRPVRDLARRVRAAGFSERARRTAVAAGSFARSYMV